MAQNKALQVRSAVLSHYEVVAQGLGLNPTALLRKVGLTPKMLASPTHLIPFESAVALLEISAEESGCSTFGLRMAQARVLSDFGPISLLLTHQPSIRLALHTIAHYRHLLNEALGIHLVDRGKYTDIREALVSDWPGGTRQSTELAVGVLMLIFRAILGLHWRPVSAHFMHSPSTELVTYRRLLSCPVHFDSEFNGLTCLQADMDKPNAQADATMASYAQSFIDAMPRRGEKSLRLDVRRSAYLLLPMGRASVEQIAAGLGMNVRTLQRRLDEQGLVFSNVLNDVRCELAQRYIVHTHHPMSRVAEQLGYSNLSSFTRWFKAQFGCAPSQMRAEAVRE